MDYLSVSQYAEKYSISERTAHNYCALGKIDVFFDGKDLEYTHWWHLATKSQDKDFTFALSSEGGEGKQAFSALENNVAPFW